MIEVVAADGRGEQLIGGGERIGVCRRRRDDVDLDAKSSPAMATTTSVAQRAVIMLSGSRLPSSVAHAASAQLARN